MGLSCLSVDIPVSQKNLDQANQKLCLLRLDIDNEVDVSLHVGTDVPDFSDRLNRLPSEWVNLILDGSYLVNKPTGLHPPEISDGSLETPAGKCGR